MAGVVTAPLTAAPEAALLGWLTVDDSLSRYS
jgi:hypothetical protein